MKKGLIFASTLAMVLGVGLAVGANQGKASRVEADGGATAEPTEGKTVYCKMDKGWWKADGAAVGVHYWGSCEGTTWPGVRMTPVATDTDVWKYTLPVGADKVIFVRVPGSGEIAYWGAQTDDLEVPTNENNMFTITNEQGTWMEDGNKCEGKWSKYPPAVTYSVTCVLDGVAQTPVQVAEGDLPAAPAAQFGKTFSGWCSDSACTVPAVGVTADTTVYGKFTALPIVTYTVDLSAVSSIYAEPHLYAFEPSGAENANWPGLAYNGNPITIPNDATFIITDGAAEGTKQTVDITQSGVANDTLRVLASLSEGKNEVVWVSTIDVPKEDGYYIVGTKSSWKFASATKMDVGQDGNKAQLLGYQGSAGEKFKVRSYFSGETKWYGWEGENDYSVGEADKLLDIYINGFNLLFVGEHVVPDVPKKDGYYICGSFTDPQWKYASAVKMTNTELDGNAALYYGLVLKENDEIRVRSYLESVDRWATLGNVIDPKDETFAVSDFNLKVLKDGSYDVYAKEEGNVLKFYVAVHVEKYEVTLTGVKFEGRVNTEATVDFESQLAYEGLDFEPNLSALSCEGYYVRGVYTDEACTVPYEAKKFTEAGQLYVKLTRAGYYVAGDATFSGSEDLAWKVDGAVYMPAAVNDTEHNLLEGTVTIPSSASEETPIAIKPLEYTGNDSEPWKGITYNLGAEYKFCTKDEQGNLVFTKGGTFAVYVTKVGTVYLSEGAQAFYTKFLTETGDSCSIANQEERVASLKLKWADLKATFNSLSAPEKAEIQAIGFDGGVETGDDLHKVMARYHYIVSKYGSEVFENFIFQEEVKPSMIYGEINSINIDGNPTFIIVISIAAISAIALSVLIIYKKRKHN